MARIDGSTIAMLGRADALLRDITRSGGRDTYDHLKSHGHHHSTIRRALRCGLIREPRRRIYEIVEGEQRRSGCQSEDSR